MHQRCTTPAPAVCTAFPAGTPWRHLHTPRWLLRRPSDVGYLSFFAAMHAAALVGGPLTFSWDALHVMLGGCVSGTAGVAQCVQCRRRQQSLGRLLLRLVQWAATLAAGGLPRALAPLRAASAAAALLLAAAPAQLRADGHARHLHELPPPAQPQELPHAKGAQGGGGVSSGGTSSAHSGSQALAACEQQQKAPCTSSAASLESSRRHQPACPVAAPLPRAVAGVCAGILRCAGV